MDGHRSIYFDLVSLFQYCFLRFSPSISSVLSSFRSSLLPFFSSPIRNSTYSLYAYRPHITFFVRVSISTLHLSISTLFPCPPCHIAPDRFSRYSCSSCSFSHRALSAPSTISYHIVTRITFSSKAAHSHLPHPLCELHYSQLEPSTSPSLALYLVSPSFSYFWVEFFFFFTDNPWMDGWWQCLACTSSLVHLFSRFPSSSVSQDRVPYQPPAKRVR